MALVLNESPKNHPQAPENLPKCNSFIYGAESK